MSSQRVVASCVVVALIVGTGGWYAAWAFPLQRDSVVSSSVPRSRVASTSDVTPEQGGIPQPGDVALQRSGGAATSPRPVAPAPSAAGPLERQAKPITPENPIPRRTFSVPVERPAGASPDARFMLPIRVTLDRQGRVAEVRPGMQAEPLVAAFLQAAMDAIKQWQYDPPADGPISFDVFVGFLGPGNAVTTQQPVPDRTSAELAASQQREFVIAEERARLESARGAGQPVRVGGAIRAPKRTRDVPPEYPAIAQSARVQGVVILEATIGADGRVQDARVLRSIPLLDQAARDAVLQWEFEPTLLNGQPVPVIMTMTVQFTLNDPVQ